MTKVNRSADRWWIMGDLDGNYVHWKGDGILGCYVQTNDPEDAERFGTKDEALLEIASPFMQDKLDWGGGEIVPLRVTKTVRVERGP